jgi:hypothetical protein
MNIHILRLETLSYHEKENKAKKMSAKKTTTMLN